MRIVGYALICLSLIACSSSSKPGDGGPGGGAGGGPGGGTGGGPGGDAGDGPGVIRADCAVTVASDGQCSIREAIANATDGGKTHADCAAGTDESTVVLPSGCTFALAVMDNGEQPESIGTCSQDDSLCFLDDDCHSDECIEGQCGGWGDACAGDFECTQTCDDLLELPAVGNALPIVAGTVVVEGNGSTILRETGGASMRFFEVAEGGSLTLKDVTLSRGTSTGDGGAILVRGSLTLLGSTIENSATTGNGGAIAGSSGASCKITVNDSILDGCTADEDAGAIQQSECVLAIDRSTFSDNRSSFAGGAVNCNSSSEACTVTNSTFRGNIADGFGGGAISLFHDGPKTVTQCTFHQNKSLADGGAIVANWGTPTIAFSTFSANECTGEGGGIYSDSELTLASSVLEKNIAAGVEEDVVGTVTSGGYNHIESTPAGFTPTTGDVTGMSAGLTAIADNGGPTRTLAPAAGSLLVDAVPSGTNGCGSTYVLDQRGNPRPGNGSDACDKGAVEL